VAAPCGRIARVSVHQHRLILLRHGETEWSRSGKHTGRTDIELLDIGREQATLAAEVIGDLQLRHPLVVSSPRQRAQVTAALAGLTVDEVSPLLAEWDYGDYEGLTTPEIRETVPGWTVWTHESPGGETAVEVSDRADAAIALALEHMESRDVVFVGHGHFSRSVLTKWVEQPLREGARYGFGPASVAVCGFEYGLRQLKSLGLTAHREPVTT